ncbi:hypothetical protein [Vibrio coralliilyticus]|uniref:hypothetical protein n=2 Tax=Vibrio coralliilyticus TaxID=190893 RepID=UPI00155F77EF|nr:hypothetical protein [Vibrio coralliilyticus]NRF28648.1 hypothetical protein [Vibrio coralliilyticus]NRF51541.1 hypothetical protein [Vibrio coralliilyticus]
MSIFGFSAQDVISILQLGFSGVAFLFLAMSFTLMRKEQDKDGGADEKMLESIKFFSKVSLCFAVLVVGTLVFDKSFPAPAKINPSCTAAMERAEVLSQQLDTQTVESLRALIRNTISDCNYFDN